MKMDMEVRLIYCMKGKIQNPITAKMWQMDLEWEKEEIQHSTLYAVAVLNTIKCYLQVGQKTHKAFLFLTIKE